MDYTLETAFCEDTTRDFIFDAEQKILNLIQKKEDHYGMPSKSQDEPKGSKDKQPITRSTPKTIGGTKQSEAESQEESKQSENLRAVIITKAPDSRAPLLGLTDYLTRIQKEKHEVIIQRLKKQGPKRKINETEQKEIPEDQKVIFKGRGKTRWNPDDIDKYEYERPTHGFTNSNVQNGNGANKKVKYVEKATKNEETTRSKNTRTGVLNRINNILQSSKPNASTESQETQQQLQSQKETETAKNVEQLETDNKNSSPEELSSTSNSMPQQRQQQTQKSVSQRTAEPSQGKTFLPSWNHMLLIYEVQPNISEEEIIATIKKETGAESSPRMHSPDKGIVVFDSCEDAQKALICEALAGFKLAPFDNSKKDIFKNVFTKEFVNLENLRPKRNKDVAIRMINGHLNIK